MRYPLLSQGDRNLAVTAMKRAIQRDLQSRGTKIHGDLTGNYGRGAAMDAAAWKKIHNIKDAHGRFRGEVFGQTSWRRLEPLLNTAERAWMLKRLDQIDRHQAETAGMEARATLRGVAERFLAIRWQYHYAQIRPFPLALFHSENRDRFDCSSTVITMYRAASITDPSGNNYSGYGDTGALWNRGVRVHTPQVGDLGFYGWQTFPYPRPIHVVMYIGNGRVVSFGSTPPWSPPWNYRSDFLGWRTYL